MIWVDRAERVLARADRNGRALERARLTWVLRHRPAPPDVARALAEGDEHAQRGDGIEHCECVALRLVERVHLLFRARVDREAR